MDITHFTLVSSVGDGKHTACLMSARALLDGRAFNDEHPSAVLRAIGIRINDGPWWSSDAERTATLLPIAMDERLCASKCDASATAERKRAEMCAQWDLSFAAPFALEQAALALETAEIRDHAATLREHASKLRQLPTNADAAAADAAYAAAYAAARAAYAAARAAYAADAKKEIRDSLIALFLQLF